MTLGTYDAVFIRKTVAYVFVCVQLLKLYSSVAFQDIDQLTKLISLISTDIILLLTILYLNIPRLKPSTLLSISILLVSAFINLKLSQYTPRLSIRSNLDQSLHSFHSTITSKNLKLGRVEDESNDDEEEENLGSFVVNMIVPDTATINPFNRSFCTHYSSNGLAIPINIKGTSGPWILKYGHPSLLLEIVTIKIISPELIVEHPGVYEILSIKSEANGIDATIINASISIPACPLIKWSHNNKKEVCLSERKESIAFQLTGDYPILLTINHIYSNKNETLQLKCEEMKDCAMDYATNQAGINTFHIVKIKDVQGNTGCFTTNLMEECAYYDTLDPFIVTVRTLPTINFTNTEVIKRHQIDSKVTINVEKLDTVHGVMEHVESKDLILILDRSVQVERSGHYQIKDATDDICNNDSQKSSIKVVEVYKPMLSVREIQGSNLKVCARGGLSLALNLVGNYPFQTKIRLTGKDVNEVSIVDIESADSIHRINIYPSIPGQYTLTVLELKDLYFDWHSIIIESIDFNVYPQTTIIVPTIQNTFCKNDQIEITLIVDGVSPWQIKYMIKHKNSVKKFDATLQEIGVNKLLIDGLSEGGRHEVVILEAMDGQGCTFDTSDTQLHINVREERPLVAFKSPSIKYYLDTDTPGFELEMKGIAPFKIGYKLNGADEIKFAEFETDYGLIKAAEFGECDLVSVSDSFCTGNSISNLKVTSTAFTRPALNFHHSGLVKDSNNVYIKIPVCESETSSVKMNAIGERNSTLKYKSSQDLAHDQSSMILESKNGSLEIPMETSPGEHTYTLVELSDANYRVPMSIQINQKVYAAPRIMSFKASETNKKCFASDTHRTIDVSVRGESPFELSYSIQGEVMGNLTYTEKFTNENHTIVLPALDQQDPFHTIDVIGFKDKTGCSMIESNTKLSTRIMIGKQIKVEEMMIKRDSCIGDLALYRVDGQSPFSIKVKLETSSGIEEYIESVTDSIIGIYLGKPSRIISVRSCDNDGCCAEIDGNIIVHESPRLIVTDGVNVGGETSVNVSFHGTLPFAFSYKRKSEAEEKIENVKNIQQHEYTIRTKEEGKFTFLSITDKFCKYPRIKNQNKIKANIIIE